MIHILIARKRHSFRADAVQYKAEVKRGEAQLSEFAIWLIQKQDEADRLMDSW